MGSKRIYAETVKRWAKRLGIASGTLIGLIFMYLFAIGAISNVSYSGDTICAGTENDPCYAYINFTANEDIFIYPTDYDPWGRETIFEFDPNVRSWKLERSWGTGWREIPLDKTCKGTWCGGKYGTRDNKYSIAFREGRDYKLRITVYKNDPNDNIKWGAFSGVDEIDPTFYGLNNKSLKKEYDEPNREISFNSKIDNSNQLKIKLETEQIHYVIRGKNRIVAIIKIENNFGNYPLDLILGPMELIDLKINETFERDYYYEYQKSIGTQVVWDWKEVCTIKNYSNSSNETTYDSCNSIKDGWYPEEKFEWVYLNTSRDMAKGNMIIRLIMDVLPNEKGEWVPTYMGIRSEEFAGWQESWNVDIISYWKLDRASGTVLDSVGTGVNNGTITGAVIRDVTGKINKSFDFTPDAKYVNVGAVYGGNLDAVTWSAWFKSDITSSDDGVMGRVGGNFPNIQVQSNLLGAKWAVTSGTAIVTTAFSDTSSFHHVVATWDNADDTLRLYLDGSAVGTDTTESGQAILAGDLIIGAYNVPSTSNFDGKVDEAFVSGRAWSSSEILDLYNAQKDGFVNGSYSEDFAFAPISSNLLNPFDNQNLTSSTVVFASTPVDAGDSTGLGVRVYGNWSGSWVLNESNSSAFNNTQTNITVTGISDGIYIYNIQVNNSDDLTLFNTSNFTFTIDTINPSVSYDATTESDNAYLNRNYVLVNISATDTNLFAVRLNWNGTNETFATNVGNNYWENKTSLSDGNYTFYGWANDSIGRYTLLSEREILIDTTNPQISFVTPSANNTVSDKTYIPIEVDVTETNPKNITYIISNDTGIWNTTTYLMETDSANVTINFTGLADGTYLINVSTSDDAHNINSTEKWYVTLASVSLRIDGLESNRIIELGSIVNLTANTSLSWVPICISINHSAYGTNYTCDTGTVTLNFTPTNFRKTLFSTDSDNYNVYFDDVPMTFNFTVSSHQYDEPDALSVNITGTNNPMNILFHNLNNTAVNLSNATEEIRSIDRYFPGKLNGSLIWLDHDYINTNTTINISYSSAGEAVLYFLLDDIIDGYHSNVYRFFLNLTGFSRGLEYTKGSSTSYPVGFADFDFVDKSQTDCQLDATGIILAKNVSRGLYFYDDFEDNSFNESLWTNNTVNSGTCAGDLYQCVEEKSGTLALGAASDLDTTKIANVTSDKLSIISDIINFSLVANYSGSDQGGHSSGNAKVYYGTSLLWDLDELNADPDGAEAADAALTFQLSKVNQTHWSISIWGVENATASGRTPTGTIYDGTIEYFSLGSNKLNFYVDANGDTSDGSTGEMNMNVQFVNRTLWTRENCTIISNSIYDASGDITEATFSFFVSSADATEEDRTYWISADNGVNWEAWATPTVFSNTGRHLRWRADFNITGTDNFNVTEGIIKVTASVPAGNITNLSMDWGGDGTWDYNLSGQLNNTNTYTTANLSFINISAAFVDANRYLSGYTPHTYIIPLVISSDSIGYLQVNGINLTYSPNPVVLNTSHNLTNVLGNSTNFTIFRIPMSGDNSSIGLNGTVLVNDLRYDYAGGNETISITAHFGDLTGNITRKILYHYSRWDYWFVPLFVNYLEFIPITPTSTNVSPFGQSPWPSSVPILNITNLGYSANSNLSVYLNDTSTCVNLTMSITENKTDGANISVSSWISLANNTKYLQTTNISMWADYSCTGNDWSLFQPYLYFRQCQIDVDTCSEEL